MLAGNMCVSVCIRVFCFPLCDREELRPTYNATSLKYRRRCPTRYPTRLPYTDNGQARCWQGRHEDTQTRAGKDRQNNGNQRIGVA